MTKAATRISRGRLENEFNLGLASIADRDFVWLSFPARNLDVMLAHAEMQSVLVHV